MGSNESKFTKDEEFMEKAVKGGGEVALRWKKKYGFKGNFDTKDILGLQVQLKVEINQKTGKKKKKREDEYKLSEAWLVESKRRDAQREDRKKRKAEQRQNALSVGVVSDDETQSGKPQLAAPAAPRAEARADRRGSEVELQEQMRKEHEERQRRRQAEEDRREERKDMSRQRRMKLKQSSIPRYKGKSRGQRDTKHVYPLKDLEKHQNRYRGDYDGNTDDDDDSEWSDTSDCDECGPKPGGVYPLVEVANPRYGQPIDDNHRDTNPTIQVYRPWSAHDRKKATGDIMHPSKTEGGPDRFIQLMRGIFDSYRLNGYEVADCYRDVLKGDWARVKEDYAGGNAVGVPYQHNTAEWRTGVDALEGRIRVAWPQQTDYGVIATTKQKDDEKASDYRHRLEAVYRTHSGIPHSADANGPYQQQLKMHFMNGLREEVSRRVRKGWVHQGTGTVDQAVEQATHAERVIKEQTKGTFTITSDGLIAFQGRPHNQNRGRGRGRGGYKNNSNRDQPGKNRNQKQKNIDREEGRCFKCHKKGHLANDCRSGGDNSSTA